MSEQIGLLRGKGNDLGPYSLAFPRHERSLVRVLAEQANRRPDEVWLVMDNGTLTYAHAYGFVNRVARAVQASVGTGAHVGVYLRNSLEFMPCFLGPMAAGGVTVPLNADARGPLLQYIIETSDARLLIVLDEFVERLAAMASLGVVEQVVRVTSAGVDEQPDTVRPGAVAGVPIVDFEEWLDAHPEDPPGHLPAHDDIALIQFTSGTTGRSKGAMFPHQYLYLCSSIVSDALQRTPQDVLFTPLPLYHVGAQHIICNSALHAGARAILPARFSASSFFDEAAASGATSSMLVGPMASILLKTVEQVPDHSLTTIQCVPPPPNWEQFEQRFGVKLLWQGYGSTECYPLPPRRAEQMIDAPSDAIGHPLTWMEYGVVDEHDNLLPPGEVGELVFRPLLPHAMMRGYYQQPEATTIALRNMMFHTGDLGMYDEDGLLYYRGRMQERIRRRGENVSAFELEMVATGHPLVMEAAAYGVPGEFGEHDIKLDCIVKEPLDHATFHAWLTDNLPRYMVPRYLEFADEFPKTPSHRIEKYKLAALPLDRSEVWDQTGGASVSKHA